MSRENLEKNTANASANLENQAFDELEKTINESGLSVDQIIDKLKDSELDYDEKNKLHELLLQNADLQRIKGKSIDKKIEQVLEDNYFKLDYSTTFKENFLKDIPAGDVKTIGEILKDEMITDYWSILAKLSNDEERTEVFNICKKRVRSACAIINQIENIDLALKLYVEVYQIANKFSYSDEDNLRSTSELLARKLFELGKKETLLDYIKKGFFKLSYLENFVHQLGSDQQAIIDLIKDSPNIEEIKKALKFITEPELIKQLTTENNFFSKLRDDEKNKVLEYSKILIQALNSDPDIIALSELKEDREGEGSIGDMEKNKFVVGIKDDKYVIAWSNTDVNKYHKNIFKSLSDSDMLAPSGGCISLKKQDNKILITMEKNSTKYGYYSKELLEKYRDVLEKNFKESLGDQEFELIINTSTNF